MPVSFRQSLMKLAGAVSLLGDGSMVAWGEVYISVSPLLLILARPDRSLPAKAMPDVS